jgi:hypothetical protein
MFAGDVGYAAATRGEVGMAGRTTFVVRAACAVVLATSAAGCGADTASAAQVVAAAPETTLKAHTARTEIDVNVTAAGKHQRVNTDGVVDLRTGDAVLRMDTAAIGIPGVEHDLEMRIVGAVGYVDVRALAKDAGEKLPSELGGARWLKFDFSKLQEGAEALNNDPSSSTSQLQYLRGVSEDGVEDRGKENVRDTETTHYHADIDLEKLQREIENTDMSDAARVVLEKSLDVIDGDTIPTDVWVDDDGRVRRLETDTTVSVRGRKVTTEMRMEFFGFGVRVDVEKPPADDVADARVLSQDPGQEA